MYKELLKELTSIDALTASLKNIGDSFSINSAIMILMMVFA